MSASVGIELFPPSRPWELELRTGGGNGKARRVLGEVGVSTKKCQESELEVREVAGVEGGGKNIGCL